MRSVPPGSRPPPESGGASLSRVVLQLHESISLRTEEGLFFGELTRFGGGRMEVESEGRFELRSEVEFQLKLPSFNSTVYGVALVLRVISRTAFLSQITLRILRMRDRDRERLQQFVAYTAQGRSKEQSSTQGPDPSEGNPWGIRSLDSEQHTSAGRTAKRDAMRRRFDSSSGSRSRSVSSQGTPAPTSPPRAPVAGSASPSRGASATSARPRVTSAWSQRTSPEQARRIGRAAISETLERHTREQKTRQRGEPEISDHEGTTAFRPPPRPTSNTRRELRAQQRPDPTSMKTPRLPNAADPQVSLRRDANPILVSVRYSSRATYLGDYQAYLSRGLLFLKYAQQPPAQGSALSVTLMLPSGLSLTVEASVNSILSSGFGLSLRLDKEAHALLASAARV